MRTGRGPAELPACLPGQRRRTALDKNSANAPRETQLFLPSQTDVTGTCETHYAHAGVLEDNLLMTKTKNLLACSHRMEHHLSVQSTQYASPNPAHALPLLR